jgi:hypothetical protein
MRRCRLRILYVLIGAMCLSMMGCQEPTGGEEEIKGVISREGMALNVADGHARDAGHDGEAAAAREDGSATDLPDGSSDAFADAPSSDDATASPDEAPPSEGIVLFAGVPEENVPVSVVMGDNNNWCTTDSAYAEPALAVREQRAVPSEYQPVLFVAPEIAPRVPSRLVGGQVLTLTPDPQIGALFENFRAQGCQADGQATSRACTNHPYAQALARELEDPTEAFESLRAQYAEAHRQLRLAAAPTSAPDEAP